VWLILEEALINLHGRTLNNFNLPSFAGSGGDDGGQTTYVACKLSSNAANATGAIDDQDSTRFITDPELLKELPSGESNEGNSRRVLEAKGLGFRGNDTVISENIFCVGMAGQGGSEEPDFFPYFKGACGDRRTDRAYSAGGIEAYRAERLISGMKYGYGP
jgi:hypothetical protein